MNLQLDTLENDFDIQPETIVAFINQLDFGDEICRYKNNKIYKNSKFVKIKTEETMKVLIGIIILKFMVYQKLIFKVTQISLKPLN